MTSMTITHTSGTNLGYLLVQGTCLCKLYSSFEDLHEKHLYSEWGFPRKRINYISLHYITLHYTTLHGHAIL